MPALADPLRRPASARNVILLAPNAERHHPSRPRQNPRSAHLPSPRRCLNKGDSVIYGHTSSSPCGMPLLLPSACGTRTLARRVCRRALQKLGSEVGKFTPGRGGTSWPVRWRGERRRSRRQVWLSVRQLTAILARMGGRAPLASRAFRRVLPAAGFQPSTPASTPLQQRACMRLRHPPPHRNKIRARLQSSTLHNDDLERQRAPPGQRRLQWVEPRHNIAR